MSNPLFGDALNVLAGVRIIEDWSMVDWHEDWSGARSIGRARRRRRMGHRQRIRRYSTPKKEALHMKRENAIVMHPEMARALKQQVSSYGRTTP